MTAPFGAIFVGYSTPLRANFMYPGQFSGTTQYDDFRETHVLGVSKSREALQSELRISNDGSVSSRFRKLQHSFRLILCTQVNFHE